MSDERKNKDDFAHFYASVYPEIATPEAFSLARRAWDAAVAKERARAVLAVRKEADKLQGVSGMHGDMIRGWIHQCAEAIERGET